MNRNRERTQMNKGWECPKCGRVYAPFWAECIKCNKETPKQYPSEEILDQRVQKILDAGKKN